MESSRRLLSFIPKTVIFLRFFSGNLFSKSVILVN